MPQTYTKDELMALGVYELRNLAREIGVKAPTMLTKEEIANAIILVLRGEEKPYRTTFGRPVKSGGKFVEALNLLKGQTVPREIIQTPKNLLNNYCSFLSNDMIIPTFAEVSFRGYVKVMQENTAIVMAKGYCVDDFVHNVVITKEIFSDYPLKDGDIVECLAASIGEDRPKVVTQIKSVNGRTVINKDENRDDFKKMASFHPDKKIVLARSYEECTNFKVHDKLLPIGFGSRTLISCPNTAKRVVSTYEYANAISCSNNVEILVVAVGESPEDRQEIKSELKQADYIFDNISEENVLELLEIKINHLLREVELGYDEVLIISSLHKLKQYLKNALKLYALSEQELDNYVNKKLLDLMNLAKNVRSNGSLTVIAFAEEGMVNVKEDIYLSTINTYIKINPYYLTNTYVSIDLKNSYINRKEKLLKNTEFAKSETFLMETNELNLNKFAERFKEFIK